MTKRGSGPALYELMGGRGGARARRAVLAEHNGAAEGPAGPGWLSPGRVFRLPAGYLLLAAGITVAMLVAAYVLGFARGEQTGREEFAEQFSAEVQTDGMGRLVSDPLLQASGSGSDVGEGGGGPVQPALAISGSDRPWGAVEVARGADPRQAGLNYYVLITTRRDRAIEFARFCRDQGLEAYVDAVNNSALREVFVLPGFRAEEKASSKVTELEQLIRQVERRWAIRNNLRDDFDLGFYARKHSG